MSHVICDNGSLSGPVLPGNCLPGEEIQNHHVARDIGKARTLCYGKANASARWLFRPRLSCQPCPRSCAQATTLRRPQERAAKAEGIGSQWVARDLHLQLLCASSPTEMISHLFTYRSCVQRNITRSQLCNNIKAIVVVPIATDFVGIRACRHTL